MELLEQVGEKQTIMRYSGPYVAEVARVITMTTVDASGNVVAATGGFYQQYCDGFGAVFVSALYS